MRSEVWLGRVHGYRYDSPDPDDPRYHLLIVHGLGGHGGTYDVFCEPMARRGVRVHSIDLPGHGKARNSSGNFRYTDWLEDIDEASRLIRDQLDRPVFVLASSMASTTGFHALAVCPAVDGAVTMGPPVRDAEAMQRVNPSHNGVWMISDEAADVERLEGDDRRIDVKNVIDWNRDYAKEDANVLQKKLEDPLRTWSYGFASMRSLWTYVPPSPPSENTKPILVTNGGEDPLLPEQYMRACYDQIGGPKERFVMEGAGHQLMLYYTDAYLEVVDGWITRQIADLADVAGEAAS
jgi:pimeloyl-ACP methyl ester carboxylesterase